MIMIVLFNNQLAFCITTLVKLKGFLQKGVKMKNLLNVAVAAISIFAAQVSFADCGNLNGKASQAVLAFVANNYGAQAAKTCESEMNLHNAFEIKDHGRNGSQYIYSFDYRNCRLTGLFVATYMKNDSGRCVNTAVYRGTENRN